MKYLKIILASLLAVPVMGQQAKNVQTGPGVAITSNKVIVSDTTGRIKEIPIEWQDEEKLVIPGNLTIGGNIIVSGIGGADANGQLLIASSGNFVKGNITGSNGIVVAPSAGALSISSNHARNFITSNGTATTNSTGNITFAGTGGINVSATGQTVTIDGSSISGGSLPGGVAVDWETADLGNLPGQFIVSGDYGTAGPDVTGNYTKVVQSYGTVGNVTVDVPPGPVAENTVITFGSETSGVFYRATTNGTDPSYTVGTSGGNFTVTADVDIEVIGNKKGWFSSPIRTLSYTVASGGPSIVGSAIIASAGAGGGTFTSEDANTTGANFIAVAKVWYGGTEPTLSDSKSNTFTSTTARVADGGNFSIRWYYVYEGTVGAGHSFTLTGTGHYGAIIVFPFSSVAASPLDQENGYAENAWTTMASGEITPGQASTISFTGIVYDTGSGTITSPATWASGSIHNPVTGSNVGIAATYKVLSDASPVNPTWASDSSYLYGAASHITIKY